MIVNMFSSSMPNAPAILALLILFVMLVGFVRESFSASTVAFLGAVGMLVIGLVDATSFEEVVANNALWTIAAMFVLSSALVRVGLISELTNWISRHLKTNPVFVLVVGSLAIMILSAFMNNTPVVVVMIPVVVQLSRQLGTSASKFLIPLSYLAILGGMLTLIGTSTNLLVDGIVRKEGMAGFSLFEITPVTLVLAIWGLIYIVLFGKRLLPDRASMAEMLSDRKKMSFFTEVAIPQDSALAGRNVMDVELFKRDGMRVIDVLRGDESLRRQFPEVALELGDRVVLRTGMDELLGLKEHRELEMVEQLTSKKTITVEALISPGCSLAGRSLGALRLRRRYGVYPLAVHRSAQNLGRQLDDIVVRVGDTLLLEGAAEDIQRLSNDVGLVALSEPEARSYRREKAPWVIAIWLVMIGTVALGIFPIFLASLLAVAAVLLIRAVDIDEALESVEGEILLLIFSMLIVGSGLQNSGAIDLIVDGVAPWLATLPAFWLVWSVFFLASFLTEMISNNAVAVILTPVAIALGASIGVDPRPLVVAVMIGASCAFSTPIGYQTNTLVYGPGGYKFTDFLRMGLPLNISIGLLAAFVIPHFFPL